MFNFGLIFVNFLVVVVIIIPATIAAENNDTSVVGSVIHEMKLNAPSALGGISSAVVDDLTVAASKKSVHENIGGGHKGKGGYRVGKSAKDDNGYDNYDTYNVKDGDSYGFQESSAFGKKEGDGMKKGYRKSSRYGKKSDDDDFEEDDKPKYTEYHYEQRNGRPAKAYKYESEDTQLEPRYYPRPPSSYSSVSMNSQFRPSASLSNFPPPSTSYGSSSGISGSIGSSSSPLDDNNRKKKEQMSAATDYENVEYSDPEDAVAPVQEYEEQDADPEYAAVYGDYGGDVYD